jgi:phosphoribosylformylglycinamidine synthase
MPIVSGNVSLYNETDGKAILPTPTIGAVGLIGAGESPIIGAARDGDVLVLIGETHGHLGQSALLAEVFHREDGDAPAVDLDAEKRNGTFIRANRDLIQACSDLSDGGLAVAAFEMAEAAGLGVHLDSEDMATLFGEDQARYVIACNFDQAEALMVAASSAGVSIETVGKFGGSDIRFGSKSAAMSDVTALYRNTFADTFA